jgi:hypothetical protein
MYSIPNTVHVAIDVFPESLLQSLHISFQSIPPETHCAISAQDVVTCLLFSASMYHRVGGITGLIERITEKAGDESIIRNLDEF